MPCPPIRSLLRVGRPLGLALLLWVISCGGTVTVEPGGSGAGGSHSSGGTGGVGAATATGGIDGTGSWNGTGSGPTIGTGGTFPTPCADSDGDGISDENEHYWAIEPSASWDSDGDSTPDYLDNDSDNDLIVDADEFGGTWCGTPRDTDGDLRPDYIDDDSDGDHVLDSDEVTHGLDWLLVNTNEGCEDIAVYTFGVCDPSKVVIHASCGGAGTGYVRLDVSREFPSRLGDLTTVIEPWSSAPDSFSKSEVVGLSAVDAGTIENGQLKSIEPGVQVTLLVSLGSTWEGIWRWTARIKSASQGVIAANDLLLVVERCPK